MDVAVSERIAAERNPPSSPWSPNTRPRRIKEYAEYLWILRGEIVRRTHFEGRDRLSGRALILKYIHAQGGFPWNEAGYARHMRSTIPCAPASTGS